MGFWDKSLRIFKYLCDNGTQSVRRVAHKTGFSTSSVHRLTQAMERRDHHPESWLWETAEGRGWLLRLVAATVYTFGLKRGVGMDTMHEFFIRLRLATQGGRPRPCAECCRHWRKRCSRPRRSGSRKDAQMVRGARLLEPWMKPS